MCLAVPSKVVGINKIIATVDVYGAHRDVSLFLMPEEVSVGDYVLVHAGFALQKVDEEAAKEALKFLQEVLEQTEEESL